MEIAFKNFTFPNGLNGRRSINKKIIIDLENKCVTVEGDEIVYAPNGDVFTKLPYRYQVDNIPAIPEIKKPDVLIPAVFDTEGHETSAAQIIIGDIIQVAAEANPRFDNLVESEVGKIIKGMIQNTLNNQD